MPDSPVEELRLGYFSASIVSRVAQLDSYSRHGLRVIEDAVPSSTEQFRRLLDGTYDVVLTSPDNVLNYGVNLSNPLARLADIRILAGVDMGLGLSLMGAPGLSGIEALRGGRIGVDVPSSGFAGVLFDLLQANGLDRSDYEVHSLGSTPRRASALLAGECDATMLNAGHDLIAEHAGAIRLARVSAAVGRYPGSVLAVRAELLDERPEVLSRFRGAWHAAVNEVLDPEQQKRVRAELVRALELPAAVAIDAYRTVLDPAQGLVPDGRFEAKWWELLVELRVRAGRFDAGVDVESVRRNVPIGRCTSTA